MKTFTFLLLVALSVVAGPERSDTENRYENRYENRLNPDTNGDYKVTSMEIKAWVPKAAEFYADFVLKQSRHNFIQFCAKFDKNPRDGKLEDEELKAFQEHCQILANYHNDQITKFDLNKNGKIDPGSEYNAFKVKYKNLIPSDGLSDIKGSDFELYKNRRLDDIYD